MKETRYSVGIESEGGPLDPDDPKVDRLVDALEARKDIAGPVVSWGGLAGGPGVRLSLRAGDPAAAVALATAVFAKALIEADVEAAQVAFAEVMTEEYMDRWLGQPAREYVGLAEIAKILGVSKQRVYELRRREDFPKPIAALAAGPVWDRMSLNQIGRAHV